MEEEKIDCDLIICRVGTLDYEKYEFKDLSKRTWTTHLYKMSKASGGKAIYIYELLDGSLSIEFEWDESKAAPFTRVHHITGITKWDFIPKKKAAKPRKPLPSYISVINGTGPKPVA